ncbi:MAG: hypothetical protein A2177_09085 [Spirochaetes bacterium RBG_13_68_11]|nr:MAG: hypothetical protein A2177_09085 [Spirochaetes bacterium RBG_13_68_11]
MRKFILILAVLAILPVAVFAEFGVGAAAFYKSPVLIGQLEDLPELNVNQFSFGADARFKLGWFQAEGLVLYSAGDVDSLNAYLDAGVALDVAILRLSLGVGPNFTYNFGESSPFQVGLNAKVGADVMLGPVSIGASYIMALNLESGIHVSTSSGLLGIQILFWL